MATTPTSHMPPHRAGRTIAVTALLAVAIALLLVALTASTDTATVEGQTPDPTTASEPDRGAGDPCALRYETRGGVLEGHGPANRCGTPDWTPQTGGRLP